MLSIRGFLILGLVCQSFTFEVPIPYKNEAETMTKSESEAPSKEPETTVKPGTESNPNVTQKEALSMNFLSEGTNHLSYTLLQAEPENRTNLVFSPLGYSVILALLAEGSREKTRNQLTSFLRIPEDTYAFRAMYKSVLSHMQEKNALNKPEFRNWFYVYKNCSVEKAYKEVLLENYFTEVKEIDREPMLSSGIDSEDSEQEEGTTTENNKKPLEEVDLKANGQSKTRRNLEKEIMSSISANRLSSTEDNSTTPESRMIVFNALYYKGKWAKPFTKVEEGSEFECPDGKIRQVQSIRSVGEFEFGRLRQLRASAINIPYEGGRYSLLVILPDRGETLPGLVKRLPKLSLNQVDSQLTKRQVKVTLPKFKYDTITRPKAALMKAGVEDVFGEKADLSGITGDKSVYLDDLVQLVTIEVDQESSAYNYLTTTNTVNLRASVAEFTAQRPFLYYLRDRIDNFVVVAGKVEEPLTFEDSSS